MDKKVCLLTGASSGIGEEACERFIKEGFIVYGLARRVEKMKKIASLGVHIRSMDVTNPDSIQKVIDEVMETHGRIDILVNNAGYGLYGSVEETPIDQAVAQFEVNVFGVGRTTQAVLPIMRKQKSGTIINIGSIVGRISPGLGAGYNATKFALEAYSDALRAEVAEFNINVVLIQPGLIKTEWGPIAAQHLRKNSGEGPYKKVALAYADTYLDKKGFIDKISSRPGIVAKTIVRAAQKSNPRPAYAVGCGAKPGIYFKKIAPSQIVNYFLAKQIK